MNIHKNARLTPRGRELLVRRASGWRASWPRASKACRIAPRAASIEEANPARGCGESRGATSPALDRQADRRRTEHLAGDRQPHSQAPRSQSHRGASSRPSRSGAKANLSEDQLRAVGKAAKTVGREVNQFTADIIKAEDFIVGMGLDLDRAARAMPAIGKAATATKTDILDLSKAGYAAISNLGLAPEELTRAFDMMALAGKEAEFELKDMAQYLPAITELAGSKGLTGARGLADIAAALQIVRRTAGDGSEAATNFNNILQKINANDAIKNFAKYGIDINAVLKKAVAEGASPLEAALRAIDKAIDGDLSKLRHALRRCLGPEGPDPAPPGNGRLHRAAGEGDRCLRRHRCRLRSDKMATSAEKLKSFQIAWANFQSTLGASPVPRSMPSPLPCCRFWRASADDPAVP